MKNDEYKKKIIGKSYLFGRKIIHLVDKFPKKRASWVITDQLLRASMSIGANIIEAQAASSRKDFINFLHHSLKSGNETKYWLALSKELDENLNKDISYLIVELDEILKMLGSSILTLKGQKSV